MALTSVLPFQSGYFSASATHPAGAACAPTDSKDPPTSTAAIAAVLVGGSKTICACCKLLRICHGGCHVAKLEGSVGASTPRTLVLGRTKNWIKGARELGRRCTETVPSASDGHTGWRNPSAIMSSRLKRGRARLTQARLALE